MSLLLMYPDHTAIHIWDEEVALFEFINFFLFTLILIDKFLTLIFFLQERDPKKFINHGRKIANLPQPNEDWFQTVLSLPGLKDLCMTDYSTINTRCLMHSWRDDTQRPRHFISRLVRYLSHSMSCVCYIFRSGGDS